MDRGRKHNPLIPPQRYIGPTIGAGDAGVELLMLPPEEVRRRHDKGRRLEHKPLIPPN